MKSATDLTFGCHVTGGLSSLLARFLPQSLIGWILLFFLVVFLAGAFAVAWRFVNSRLHGPGEKFPGELALLREVMRSVPDLIYVKDRESRFLFANQCTAEAMGAASGEELRGKSDFDYYPAEMAAGFYQDEQKVIQSGVSLVSHDEHIREADGRIRWLLSTKVPFRDTDGKTLGIIGIGRNITALKETSTREPALSRYP
jgi:PAS domain S-box-containing protein